MGSLAPAINQGPGDRVRGVWGGAGTARVRRHPRRPHPADRPLLPLTLALGLKGRADHPSLTHLSH